MSTGLLDAAGRTFQRGSRCEIIAVHHPAARADLGKWVKVTKVHPEMRLVWAHADQPITYRTNRAGRRVIAKDPSCNQGVYSMDELKIWIDPETGAAQSNSACM